MNIREFGKNLDAQAIGAEIYELIAELYPICRSITGGGVRETFRRLGERIPVEVREVPSGTPVFDWTVPREWNIRDAYVKNCRGERVIDFRKSNLHVVNYSAPVQARMTLAELRSHLFTIPEHPDWIPYRTSYYKETWGFCLSHRRLLSLPDGEYEVCIDSSLANGHLSYAECCLAGDTAGEVLISTHACHPSLCNDNLSGLAVAAVLARHLAPLTRRYTYRFLFIPGTIGSITWLCRNENTVSRIRHGLVLACAGDSGKVTYKRSRRGNAEIDRIVAHVLEKSGSEYAIIDFSPYGYDERQFCSPGFNLPVGCLTRTPAERFPEYHTSADNLDFVAPEFLADSFAKCVAVLDIIEHNQRYISRNPKCEPQLGKRGLYRNAGGRVDSDLHEKALLWVLNLADGNHTLLDICDRSGLAFEPVRQAAEALFQQGLLARTEP